MHTWPDGDAYEGGWHDGLKHGWGRYTWSHAAVYEGEWSQGMPHGYGVFSFAHGSGYRGGWRDGRRHGVGSKRYASGDLHEGLWIDGRAEGPGRYRWRDGAEYDGDWLGGRMHGRGTFKLADRRYDGEWRRGLAHGVGVLTFADGSTYEGYWRAGKRHGVGLVRPGPAGGVEAAASGACLPAYRPAPLIGEGGDALVEGDAVLTAGDRSGGTEDIAAYKVDGLGSGDYLSTEPAMPDTGQAGLSRSRQSLQDITAFTANHALETEPPSEEIPNDPNSLPPGIPLTNSPQNSFTVCHFADDLALDRLALPRRALEGARALERGGGRRRGAPTARGPRKGSRPGDTVFKGHHSHDLVLNLQLGVRHTLSTLGAPAGRLIAEHFRESVSLRFPAAGSQLTPPHASRDFHWKDYCPTVFRELRRRAGVDGTAYVLSLCASGALRELGAAGKSGSVLFASADGALIVKTVARREVASLLRMLPAYVAHLDRNPGSALLRFFGVHRIKARGGRKVRLVVMNNVFPVGVALTRCYDLKGSSLGRTAGGKGN